MSRTRHVVASGIVLAIAAAALVLAGPAVAAYGPGSKSLGDPIFPQIGNGGYDVGTTRSTSTTTRRRTASAPARGTTITARATQDLSRFSLDFQRDLEIDSVTVDGVAARACPRRRAKPRLSNDPESPSRRS